MWSRRVAPTEALDIIRRRKCTHRRAIYPALNQASCRTRANLAECGLSRAARLVRDVSIYAESERRDLRALASEPRPSNQGAWPSLDLQ